MIRGWDDEIVSPLHGVPFNDKELATLNAEFASMERQMQEYRYFIAASNKESEAAK